MKVILILSFLFITSTAFADYGPNPITAICHNEDDYPDSLRVRFQGGFVVAVAMDQLDLGNYGDDIFTVKIASTDGIEQYAVSENNLFVEADTQEKSVNPEQHWKVMLTNTTEDGFVKSYDCRF
jgi:hypothetical protein